MTKSVEQAVLLRAVCEGSVVFVQAESNGNLSMFLECLYMLINIYQAYLLNFAYSFQSASH